MVPLFPDRKLKADGVDSILAHANFKRSIRERFNNALCHLLGFFRIDPMVGTLFATFANSGRNDRINLMLINHWHRAPAPIVACPGRPSRDVILLQHEWARPLGAGPIHQYLNSGIALS
jgi:hypothetical protein